jgi:hypothetical protein
MPPLIAPLYRSVRSTVDAARKIRDGSIRRINAGKLFNTFCEAALMIIAYMK